jgi:hypothetical protein
VNLGWVRSGETSAWVTLRGVARGAFRAFRAAA